MSFTACVSHDRAAFCLLPPLPAAAAGRRCSLLAAGLEVLTKADKRLLPFKDSLLSRASLSVAREQLTTEENAQLDATLAALLHVLSNHFLAPAAFQVLEYAVRRYK